MLSYRFGHHRKLRWGGLVCSLLLLATLGVAIFGSLTFQRSGYIGGLFRGCLMVKSPGDRETVQRQQKNTVSIRWRRRGTPFVVTWWPGFAFTAKGMWKLTLPLWIPTLIVLLPTIVLWAKDRRHPPDHCQPCGYNLTGNESGVCPECGEAVKQP